MGSREGRRVFMLSPASCTGRRAAAILAGTSGWARAPALVEGAVRLGELFSFLSSLYFRGKLAYAEAFRRPVDDPGGIRIITATRGLLAPDFPVVPSLLEEFASAAIDPAEPEYRDPLLRDAGILARGLGAEDDVVLLGSVATAKYVEPLLQVFGARLLFPAAFVGRGDMSRGGLLLRAAEAGEELEYVLAGSATRTGSRPPKLKPRKPVSRR